MEEPAAATIDPATRERLERELEPGERVVWCEAPVPVARWQIDAPIVCFGAAFMLFAIYSALARHVLKLPGFPPPNPQEWSGPVRIVVDSLLGFTFLVGAGVIVALRVWFPRAARRWANALTDRRAIVLGPNLLTGAMHVRCWRRGEVVAVLAFPRAGGAGDIDFTLREGMPNPRMRGNFEAMSAAKSPFGAAGFVGISDAERVARLACATFGLSTP